MTSAMPGGFYHAGSRGSRCFLFRGIHVFYKPEFILDGPSLVTFQVQIRSSRRLRVVCTCRTRVLRTNFGYPVAISGKPALPFS
jgi:hypothetical protein